MKPLTKTTALAYLIAVFVVGAAAGGMGGFCLGVRKAFTPPDTRVASNDICQRLKSELSLDDGQMKQIEPIVGQAMVEFQSVYSGTTEQVISIMQKTNQRISQFLNSQQKAQLDKIEKDRIDFMRRMGKPKQAGGDSKAGAACNPSGLSCPETAG